MVAAENPEGFHTLIVTIMIMCRFLPLGKHTTTWRLQELRLQELRLLMGCVIILEAQLDATPANACLDLS